MRAEAIIEAARNLDLASFSGEVVSVGQKSLTSAGPLCRVGDICCIGEQNPPSLAEVVAVGQETVELLPFRTTSEVRPGDRTTLSTWHSTIPVGEGFASRAINAFGEAIDGGPPILAGRHTAPQSGDALAKMIVAKRVSTGIRAIDSLLPIAQGQRIGIFAASGVGKTTLVEQLSTRIECDKIVVCLIGERGREVERLWNLRADSEGEPPLTLVAATSDESASVRVRAMRQALALCEHWREQGEHVVLFVDSITRLAMAMREIGLAAGEPPALRSYTPNVFSALPEFVERCGAIKGKGAITAIFTVLSETDEVDDPIVETMKSLLDGHIVLSRKLAERGHFPAIDVRCSVSRVVDQLLDKPALDAASQFKRLCAVYEESRAMIDSGLYQKGANQELDHAIALQPRIQEFLMQAGSNPSDASSSDAMLQNLVSEGVA